jgi:hypothetical protein
MYRKAVKTEKRQGRQPTILDDICDPSADSAVKSF